MHIWLLFITEDAEAQRITEENECNCTHNMEGVNKSVGKISAKE